MIRLNDLEGFKEFASRKAIGTQIKRWCVDDFIWNEIEICLSDDIVIVRFTSKSNTHKIEFKRDSFLEDSKIFDNIY